MLNYKYAFIELRDIETYLKSLVIPSIVIILSIVILLLIRQIFFKLIKSWSRKKGSALSDVILKSIKTPSLIWSITLGIYLGISIFEMPEKYLFYTIKLIVIIIIFSATLFISNLVNNVIQHHINISSLSIPQNSFMLSILSVIIFLTGFLLILTTLGISITPIITTLGIGGLAIALALKDTLTNIFAGLHILIEKSIRIGDFIRLENGQEGYLEDLTWRTARIRTVANNMIIIPNSRLSQSIVTNYSLPEPMMSIQIPIRVSYSSDIEKVEKILLDIANKASQDIEGVLEEPKPIVRFTPGFSENSLDFTLICSIKEFRFQNIIQHELRKRILEKFREEGIEIPIIQGKG